MKKSYIIGGSGSDFMIADFILYHFIQTI